MNDKTDYFRAVEERNALRERLPVARTFEYEHEGTVTRVTLGLGSSWPGTHVQIQVLRTGLTVAGWFRGDGTLETVQISAVQGVEITANDLRSLSSVRMLKEWDLVARELGQQMLDGEEAAGTIVNAAPATEMLRMLNARRAARPTGKRLRGAAADERLKRVVDEYRAAVSAGDPRPRKTVGNLFGYSSEHIGYLLSQARKAGMLGPAAPGKAGETVSHPGVGDLGARIDRDFSRAENAAVEQQGGEDSTDDAE